MFLTLEQDIVCCTVPINYSDCDIAACIVCSNDECKVEICPALETAFPS